MKNLNQIESEILNKIENAKNRNTYDIIKSEIFGKKGISEDEEKKNEKNVQIFTDEHIKIIDEKITSKEKEIMTI